MSENEKAGLATLKATCTICKRDLAGERERLIGMHAACLADAVYDPLECDLAPAGRICLACPFRRTPEFPRTWMDAGRHLLNLLRLNFGVVQACHKDVDRKCAGSAALLENHRTESCLSREEFDRLEVADDETVAAERYLLLKARKSS